MKGWLYLLSNPALPDVVIFGYSPRDPQLRVDELDSPLQLPPYVVEYEMLVDDPVGTKRRIRDRLADHHEGKGRYRCSVGHVVFTIRQVAGDSFLYERRRTARNQGPLQGEPPPDTALSDIEESSSGPAAASRGNPHTLGRGDRHRDQSMDHDLFVEAYRARRIAIDVDEYKACFLYDQRGLIPKALRNRQFLIRYACLLCFLTSLTTLFFLPFTVAFALLIASLLIAFYAQKNVVQGVLQAALRDPLIFRVAVQRQVLVIRERPGNPS